MDKFVRSSYYASYILYQKAFVSLVVYTIKKSIELAISAGYRGSFCRAICGKDVFIDLRVNCRHSSSILG